MYHERQFFHKSGLEIVFELYFALRERHLYWITPHVANQHSEDHHHFALFWSFHPDICRAEKVFWTIRFVYFSDSIHKKTTNSHISTHPPPTPKRVAIFVWPRATSQHCSQTPESVCDPPTFWRVNDKRFASVRVKLRTTRERSSFCLDDFTSGYRLASVHFDRRFMSVKLRPR